MKGFDIPNPPACKGKSRKDEPFSAFVAQYLRKERS